ncbi:MAG: carboxypeptidase-like regulatory domain-containing protein [Flavipsychrobacter sp.]|nr:carboxypeptidase-like regulatory domain-containing protein [Flavipsychrobacter sp.]
MILFGFLGMMNSLQAQEHLNKQISLSINRQPIADVLEIISNKGNFYFSYNSNILPKDSLVSLPAGTRSVRNLLELLLPTGFEFRESGQYIIIRRTPLQLSLVIKESATNDNHYWVSGYVRDDQTGELVRDASVYEKDRLVAALTNRQGYFRIKLKTRYPRASLTVSKEFYKDTTVTIRTGFNQEVRITLAPVDLQGATIVVGPARLPAPDSLYMAIPQPDSSTLLYLYKRMDSLRVQRTAIGKFFLSSKLKMQSINLSRFFTVRPVQVSFTPGLSSNGRMNAQVVNNFSFNVLGGYSGGVNGAELGGIFNINKKDVQYAQVAGVVNIVGGNMKGVQVAGVHNMVLDSVTGVQVGGVVNFVKGSFTGGQIGGVINYTNHSVTGLQVAGVGNVSGREMNGVQIGGVFNYAKKLNGVQIGLINISDSSDGYSIGLINVVLKGYHKLAFYSTEVLPFNAAFKTGNHKLYSILLGGAHPDTGRRVVSFGYGIGTERRLGKQFSLNLEASTQYVFLGSWEYTNLLTRATVNLHWKISKHFSLFAGPAFSVYQSDQDVKFHGYAYPIPEATYKTISLGGNRTGWLGWTGGIHLF